jgi:lipoprotein signal peptidase
VWPARNPDYAFGIIGGTAPFLVIGAVVVLGVFLVVADVLVSRLEISAWLPAVVAGGTIGNTLDRIRFGAARDFLVTPWAIINLADVAVAAGIIGLAFALVSRLSQMRLRASGRAADCVT